MSNSSNLNDLNDLKDFRKQIDKIDDILVNLLSERFAAVKNIAEYKKARGLEVFQQDREAEVLKNISDKTDEEYRGYILQIYAEILKMSKLSQI